MPSVLVVGGGVAGLTCAWRLRRAGWDVEVLEREAEPGGRMRSEAHGDFTLDRGAQFQRPPARRAIDKHRDDQGLPSQGIKVNLHSTMTGSSSPKYSMATPSGWLASSL